MCVFLFQMVQAYAGSDITLDAVQGERFVLMGGNITGEFTQLVCNTFYHWNFPISFPGDKVSNYLVLQQIKWSSDCFDTI